LVSYEIRNGLLTQLQALAHNNEFPAANTPVGAIQMGLGCEGTQLIANEMLQWMGLPTLIAMDGNTDKMHLVDIFCLFVFRFRMPVGWVAGANQPHFN